MAQANLASQIRGLLEVHEKRGLSGEAALWSWSITALAVLLKAELARVEKEERFLSNLETRQ